MFGKYIKPERKRAMLKFLTITGSIVGLFILCAVVFVLAYLRTSGGETTVPPAGATDSAEATPTPSPALTPTPDKDSDSGLFAVPRKTNFLVMCTDETDLLTDTIITGSFDRVTHKITLLSIPRDTYVDVDDKNLEIMKKHSSPPEDGIMKMTMVHSYAGSKDGPGVLRSELERLLGIKINYYAKINLKAFREIVDAVGGIEMTIRPEGYHYEDPLQDLVINVPGGHQRLNGVQAEGVVRFRDDYRDGDIDRINVQQQFMKAFFAQALNKENILNNAATFIGTLLNYVQTDFTILDLPKYARYIKDINPEGIVMRTLPGEGRYITQGERRVSYFFHDPAQLGITVDSIFYDTSEN
ncbi:MAG: LCP family protein [Clostridiales bacterium]|jgi:LCP family protein required for cell wall assembly|nr:LCP family protein [Clostridiales bacterium]